MPASLLDFVNTAKKLAGRTASLLTPARKMSTLEQLMQQATAAPKARQARTRSASAPVQQPSPTPSAIRQTPSLQQMAAAVVPILKQRQAEQAPEQVQRGGQGITAEQWARQAAQIAQQATAAQSAQTVPPAQTTAARPSTGLAATTDFLKKALLKLRPAHMAQATSDILDWFGNAADGEYAWGQGKIIKQGLKATYVGPEGTYVFTAQSSMPKLAEVPGVADWLAKNYGLYPGMYEDTVEPVQSPYFGPGPGDVPKAGATAATTQPTSTAASQPGSTAGTQPGSSAAPQPGSGGGFLDQMARLIETTLAQQQTQYADTSNLIQKAIQSYEAQRQLMQDPNYQAQLYASLSQAIRAGVEPYAGAARRQLYEQYMGMIPAVLNSLAARGVLRSSETGRAMNQLGGNYLAGLASLETALANLLVPSITALTGFSGQQASAAETTPRMLAGLLGLLPQGGLPGIGQYLSLLDLVSNVFV